MHPTFIAALFTIAKIWKQLKCPSTDESLKKMDDSAIKMNEILPFARTWMGLEVIMLSKISQTEKDKYCMLSLIRGIEKVQHTSEYNKKEMDLQI